MRGLARLYDRLVSGLAVAAGLIVVATFLAVVYDATLRDVGLQPPRWTVPTSEFGLLYITVLAAPWLVRTRGQVVVESLRLVLPPTPRRWLERAVCLACLAICLIIGWFALEQAIDAYIRDEVEQRAVAIPLYAGYAPISLGFLLMACEFLRILFGRDSLYGQTATEAEGM